MKPTLLKIAKEELTLTRESDNSRINQHVAQTSNQTQNGAAAGSHVLLTHYLTPTLILVPENRLLQMPYC